MQARFVLTAVGVFVVTIVALAADRRLVVRSGVRLRISPPSPESEIGLQPKLSRLDEYQGTSPIRFV